MTMIMNAKSFAMRLVQVITDRICPIPIRYLFKRWQMLFLRKFSVMHNGTYKYRHRWWWNYGVNNRILFTTTNNEQHLPYDVKLIEASNRLGGKIHTVKK